MKPNPESHYLVVDVEATCDSSDAISRREMEIIEIGAVLVDGVTLAPLAELQTFVRPVRHGVLTAFCTELTTITQADVESAPLFPNAIAALALFLRERAPGLRPLFASWGRYDKSQFEQDAGYHRVELPFGSAHLNLKKRFSEQLGETKKLGMHEALRRVGLPLLGTHHRALDDARNIVRLLPWVLGAREVRSE